MSGPRKVEELGTRPVGRLLWWTCSQTTLSVGVYGIYALTNAWFVARGVGETALAAVNLVAPLLLLQGAVSTTVGVGGASIVSRALGAGKPADAARAAGSSFSVFWITAVFTTVVGLAFLDPLLRLVGATAATITYARPYAAIIIAGAIFSTGFSSIVRAEGRLAFSTMLWVIPVIVHIVLDPILIFGFKLGVVGAGLGMVGGHVVSASMAWWFFFVQKNRPYRIRLSHLAPDGAAVKEILSIGAPSFLAGIGATLLSVLVNTVLAVAGVAMIAAYAVCARVQTFVSMPQTGITQGVQPIISYNHGKQITDRVNRARTLALRSTVIYGVFISSVIALLARPVVTLFLTDQATIGEAVVALRIICIGFAFAGIPSLVSAYFQALGMPRPSYVISIGTIVAVKVPLVFLLGTLGPLGIWIALPAGELLSAALSLILLRRLSAVAVRQGGSAIRRK